MKGSLCNTINEFTYTFGYVFKADTPGRHEPGAGDIDYRQVI